MVDMTIVEKALIGTKFPSPTHKMMIEELSLISRSSVEDIRKIAKAVNSVPVTKIDSISILDLVQTYGLEL